MQDHIGTEWTTRGCGRQAFSVKNEITPGFHWRMWLAGLNNFEGWQGTEPGYSGISKKCIWSLVRRVVWLHDLFLGRRLAKRT